MKQFFNYITIVSFFATQQLMAQTTPPKPPSLSIESDYDHIPNNVDGKPVSLNEFEKQPSGNAPSTTNKKPGVQTTGIPSATPSAAPSPVTPKVIHAPTKVQWAPQIFTNIQHSMYQTQPLVVEDRTNYTLPSITKSK